MVDAAASVRSDHGAAALPRDAGPISVLVTGASAEALADYRRLSDAGIVSAAQSASWIGGWVAQFAPECIVAMLRHGGKPAFAIALEVVKTGPFRVARFMGGKHANGNFCPVLPDFPATAAEMREMSSAIRRARPDVDALLLERLEPAFDGRRNPLLALPHFPSPNLSLAVDLAGGFDAVLGRTSGKRKRKKHRSQTRKFEVAGGFRRIVAADEVEVARLFEAFLAMKQERFAKAGIANVFAGLGVQAFFTSLFAGALGQERPDFVLHGLEVAGRLRAVTGSSRFGGRITCEFGAIADDDLAHISPGEFLFFDNIREACEEKRDLYDFSVGDEGYKRLWCDLATTHFDVVLPLSVKGRALALALRSNARLKSLVKNTPLVWKVAKVLRRRTAGEAPTED